MAPVSAIEPSAGDHPRHGHGDGGGVSAASCHESGEPVTFLIETRPQPRLSACPCLGSGWNMIRDAQNKYKIWCHLSTVYVSTLRWRPCFCLNFRILIIFSDVWQAHLIKDGIVSVIRKPGPNNVCLRFIGLFDVLSPCKPVSWWYCPSLGERYEPYPTWHMVTRHQQHHFSHKDATTQGISR